MNNPNTPAPKPILPCPFCGGKAKWWNYPDVVLGCSQCKVHIKAEWYDGDLGTVEASWNTRLSPTPTGMKVEIRSAESWAEEIGHSDYDGEHYDQLVPIIKRIQADAIAAQRQGGGK